MSSWQKLLVSLAVVCALVLLGPAAALANGPSAGDQQYIDPLGGSSHHSHSGSSSSSSSSGSSTSSSSTSASSSSATPPTAVAATSTSTTTTASSDPSPKTLAFTGFDDLAVVGLGAGLLASGWLLRRISRPA